MKSINFEEHYVVEDIQKETMKHMTSDPKGVPMQTMLKGIEEKSGFTDADEIKHHDARIQFMDKHDVEMQVLSYGNGAPSILKANAQLNYVNKQMIR